MKAIDKSTFHKLLEHLDEIERNAHPEGEVIQQVIHLRLLMIEAYSKKQME